jgi:transcriptional regulator with XRE-family HTH domain
MDIVKSFGARLQKIRKEKGHSQEQLAEISGLHRTYISSLERGSRNPTLATLYVIANALDMTISSLMEGVDNE